MKMPALLMIAGALITVGSIVGGLMGTVLGMASAFQEISSSTVAPKPADLAAGISTSLVATLVGIAGAVPGAAMMLGGLIWHFTSRKVVEEDDDDDTP